LAPSVSRGISDITEPDDVAELELNRQDEWNRFVMSSPSGTIFHLCEWQTLVERVLGHRSFRLVARRGSEITGIFPISWIRSWWFGDCLVSSPLAVYGGICAVDSRSYFSLLRAGSDLAEKLKVKYLEMRNREEPYTTSLPGRDLYVTFTQDLSQGPEKLLQAMPRDTRYAIRKSLKAGLEWTEDLTLPEFYELYAQSVHRLGTPVFSRDLFAFLREIFPRQSRIFGVRKGKQAIAGVFCLYFRDQILPYYAGALPEFHKDSPNNFMYWSLIDQSCRERIRLFDFGRSKKGTGSYNFKSAWSMQISELPYRFQLARAKEVPHMSPVDGKFQKAVALWKRMPYACTKVVGPRLIRCIPSV
jgi:FemAB-related protein (PEP-CTERM system-associated)